MKKLLFMMLMLTSCTVNYTISQSVGKATDVVDNTPKTETDISTAISAPLI